jgi:hypothetical protein
MRPEGSRVGVVPLDAREVSVIDDILVPSTSGIDIAFLPNAFKRAKDEFFPILVAEEVIPGSHTSCFGAFAFGRLTSDVEPAYFSGAVVNIHSPAEPKPWTMTLPYPVLEGMSGSALTRFYNGTKLVGIAYGNRTMRIVKSEVIEYKDSASEYKESIHREVEFGLAYHPITIVQSLDEMGVKGYVVSDKAETIPALAR